MSGCVSGRGYLYVGWNTTLVTVLRWPDSSYLYERDRGGKSVGGSVQREEVVVSGGWSHFSGGLGIQSVADRVFLVAPPSTTSFCTSASLASRSITYREQQQQW